MLSVLKSVPFKNCNQSISHFNNAWPETWQRGRFLDKNVLLSLKL